MDPGSQNDVGLVELLEGVVFRDGEDVDSVAGDGLAEGGAQADVAQVGVGLDLLDHGVEVGVGEGVVVGEVDLVVGVREGVLPGEGEEGLVLRGAFGVTVLKVADVVAAPVPAQVLLLRLLYRVDDDLHAALVQARVLAQVHDVELALVPLESVRHLEEEPLRVPICINIVLNEQVVLCLGNLADEGKVATLEAGLEDEGFVGGALGKVEGQDGRMRRSVIILGGIEQFGHIAGPNVPVFVRVVDLAVRSLFVLAEDYVVEGIADPIEVHFVDLTLLLFWLLEGLEAGDDAHECGEGDHGQQGLGLVVLLLGQEHQRRRDQVLRDQDLVRLLRFDEGRALDFG